MATKRKENEETGLIIPGKKRKSETNKLLTPMNVLFKMFELDDDDFKAAARDLFKKKFSKSYVTVKTFKPEPFSETPNNSLRLLNYFGDQIIKLRVIYDSKYRRAEKEMDDAINTKCYKSLHEIALINAERFTMIDVTKPFKNVEKVTFTDGFLCEFIQSFGKVFPNANILEFNKVQIGDYSDEIELKEWPQLKNLEIRQGDGQEMSTKFFFKNLIAKNMQLENIRINLCYYDHDYDDDFELDDIPIISDLPNLKTLEISFGINDNIQNKDQKMIHFKELNHLRIQLFAYRNDIDFSGLSISVDNLHSLSLDCGSVNESVIQFITRNKSVELLKYEGAFCGYEMKFIEAFGSLPKLREIVFNVENPKDIIIRLLKACELLTKLTVRSYKYNTEDIVQQAKSDISKDPDVKNQWNIIHELDDCVLSKVIPEA